MIARLCSMRVSILALRGLDSLADGCRRVLWFRMSSRRSLGSAPTPPHPLPALGGAAAAVMAWGLEGPRRCWGWLRCVWPGHVYGAGSAADAAGMAAGSRCPVAASDKRLWSLVVLLFPSLSSLRISEAPVVLLNREEGAAVGPRGCGLARRVLHGCSR